MQTKPKSYLGLLKNAEFAAAKWHCQPWARISHLIGTGWSEGTVLMALAGYSWKFALYIWKPCSASLWRKWKEDLLEWIKETLQSMYGTQGFVTKEELRAGMDKEQDNGRQYGGHWVPYWCLGWRTRVIWGSWEHADTDQAALGWGLDSVPLTSAQVTPMLLVPGLHFE